MVSTSLGSTHEMPVPPPSPAVTAKLVSRPDTARCPLGAKSPPDGNRCLDESSVYVCVCVCVCVCACTCARTRAGQEGQENGWVGNGEQGSCTHANEGDKLLIRVFIRAVGRDRKALQLGGETSWRDGDTSFPCFTVALRESRHYITSSHGASGWREEPPNGGKSSDSAHATPAPVSVPRGAHMGGEPRQGRGRLGGGSKKHSHILLSSYQGKWGGAKESMEKQRRPKIYLAHPTCF